MRLYLINSRENMLIGKKIWKSVRRKFTTIYPNFYKIFERRQYPTLVSRLSCKIFLPSINTLRGNSSNNKWYTTNEKIFTNSTKPIFWNAFWQLGSNEWQRWYFHFNLDFAIAYLKTCKLESKWKILKDKLVPKWLSHTILG